MLEAKLYSATAKPKGSVTLPEEFDGVVNKNVIYQAVRAVRGNQRQGTHSTKTKAEVSGGNKKPWRQKGTGRARQGSIRAPHWRGGGVVFGPRPRSYRIELPKKVRRLARQSAFNQRANEGALIVIEGFDSDEPKTRKLAAVIAKLGLAGRKVLLLSAKPETNLYLSGRNLPDVRVMPYAEATAYDVLWADAVVVAQDAIGTTPKRTAKKRKAAVDA